MPDFLKYQQDGHVVTLAMNLSGRHNPRSGNPAAPNFLAAIKRIETQNAFFEKRPPAFSA